MLSLYTSRCSDGKLPWPTLLEGSDMGLEWKSKELFLLYLIKDDISSICKQSKASVVIITVSAVPLNYSTTVDWL